MVRRGEEKLGPNLLDGNCGYKTLSLALRLGSSQSGGLFASPYVITHQVSMKSHGFPPSPHLERINPRFNLCIPLYQEPDVSNVIMNILESQVTDLNYLAESPLSVSGTMNGQRHSSSAESPDPATNGGTKRKADESSTTQTPQTRAKRNRYISIAW